MIPDPFSRVANEDGVPRLCAQKCSTCLFRPGNMTNGMRAIVDDARKRSSYVMCHETYAHSEFTPAPGVEPAMCRGYYDANKDTQYGLRILDGLRHYEEVGPPPPDLDQRSYCLIGNTESVFIVDRQPHELAD